MNLLLVVTSWQDVAFLAVILTFTAVALWIFFR